MLSSSWCNGRIRVALSAMRRFCGVIVDPLPLEPVDLLKERVRIDHDPVADHRQLPRPHHTRWQQRELVGLPVDDERMAGIMSTLEANDDVGLLGQPVDDFPLPSSPHWEPTTTTLAIGAFPRVVKPGISSHNRACPASRPTLG